MIRLEALSKFYNNGDLTIKALHHVTLTLPNSGFVFIIGKSGCGKSTLLNLIGGLDQVTEGDIVCDGNRLSEMSETDLDNYRNAYLGFVFQDYCLIEDLSVYQNISLVLDLKGETLTPAQKNALVDQALRNVELDERMKNRKIKELSGGQKQRVAIARALIKEPKLILADEPTGNLDSKTAKTILDLLKTLSKDRLVLIVSHNYDDALTYADRIIQLSDGEVISDLEKSSVNTNELKIENGVLTLPHAKTLTEEQLKDVNQRLTANEIKKIEQHGDGFQPTEPLCDDKKITPIQERKNSKKGALELAGRFFKKRVLSGVMTTLAITLLVFILGLCQFFMQFNAGAAIYSAMQDNNENVLILKKGSYDEYEKFIDDKFVYTDETDIQKLKNAGYTGNIYPLYRNPFCFEAYSSESANHVSYDNNIEGIYIKETYGTVICDEAYLKNTFAGGEKLEFLAGSLNARPYGIAIPDYVADSVLNFRTNYKSYDDLLNKLVSERRYVNGVFKTDYKEKYKALFSYLHDIQIGLNRDKDKAFYKNEYARFLYDVNTRYGLAYSINPDFEEASKDIRYIDHSVCTFYEFSYGDFSIDGDQFIAYKGFTPTLESSLKEPQITQLPQLERSATELGPNEIAIEYDVFNYMFGSYLGITFTEETYQDVPPITVTLNKYDGPEKKNLVFSKKVTLVKLLPENYIEWTTKSSKCMFMGEEIYTAVHDNFQGVYGYVLDDASQLNMIYDTLEENAFSVHSKVYDSLHIVGEVVTIFEGLFFLIVIGIAAVCIILLVNYSYGTIRKRRYEIGVLKALGANSKNVALIFSIQMLMVGITICVLSSCMLAFLCAPINLQLSNELLKFVGNTDLQTIQVIQANGWLISLNALTIFAITLLSCILPFIRLNKMKPKNIILNN